MTLEERARVIVERLYSPAGASGLYGVVLEQLEAVSKGPSLVARRLRRRAGVLRALEPDVARALEDIAEQLESEAT